MLWKVRDVVGSRERVEKGGSRSALAEQCSEQFGWRDTVIGV